MADGRAIGLKHLCKLGYGDAVRARCTSPTFSPAAITAEVLCAAAEASLMFDPDGACLKALLLAHTTTARGVRECPLTPADYSAAFVAAAGADQVGCLRVLLERAPWLRDEAPTCTQAVQAACRAFRTNAIRYLVGIGLLDVLESDFSDVIDERTAEGRQFKAFLDDLREEAVFALSMAHYGVKRRHSR